MERYIGTKEIKAASMTRGEYNKYRGWEIPEDEDPTEEGYLVEYLDSPATNMPHGHTNYISWSPKDVFERAYRKNETVIERLRIERDNLDEKISNLAKAVNTDGFADKVGDVQFDLLTTQHFAMITYRRILHLRIKNLKQ